MESLAPILSGLAGAVITGSLLAWVAREGRLDLPRGHFRHGTRYRVVSVLMFAIALFMLYAALHASADQKLLALSIVAPLLAGSAVLLIHLCFVRGEVTDDTLRIYSPWRGWRTIPLASIVAYRYSRAGDYHVLLTDGHGTVRLSQYMHGLEPLADKVRHLVERDA